jgi:diguanylate cyclase (GGDEF)-like protein
VDVLELDAGGGPCVVVRDLARALSAELAILAVRDEAGEDVEVRAAWGTVAGAEYVGPGRGFVGRALRFVRAGIEPVDARSAGLGEPISGAEITHALGVPVEPKLGPRGVLCAAFARDPGREPETMLWLAESYARVASLCLHDPDALDGLLSGGRVDGLTGCLTHAAFLYELRREIARSQRHGRPLSCAFIDLDRFKRVNDRYGHLHGSRVLASIGAILRAGIRSEDTLGRYGGDEFVIMLPDTDEDTALRLSKRLRATISMTMINLPHEPIDASIGVAQWRPGSSLQALLGASDEALLMAKAAGGGAIIRASTLTPAPPADDEDERPPSERVPEARVGPRDTASIRDVLEVSAHFEKSGGASLELTAWELDFQLSHVVSAWSHAIKDGLLEPAGTDPISGEEMWCLSEHGRHTRTTDRRRPA